MNVNNPLPDIIGKTKEEAEQLIKSAGYCMRITAEDGTHYMVTCDYRTDRINVDIFAGRVQHASVG